MKASSIRFLKILGILVASAFASGCVTEGSTDLYRRIETGSVTPGACEVPIDFGTEVLPILVQRCATAGCHGKGFKAGGLNLDPENAYLNLVSAAATGKSKSRVEPGDEQNSYLIDRLLARDATLMPPGGNPLDSANIEKIVCWIEQGAEEGSVVIPDSDVSGGEPDTSPPPEVCGPEGSVPFDPCVVPILEANGCTASVCHGPENAAEAASVNDLILDLSDIAGAYAALVNAEAKAILDCNQDGIGETQTSLLRVKPNDSANSLLVQTLKGKFSESIGGQIKSCEYYLMPLGLPEPIAASDIETIVRWIDNGALLEKAD
ncbi:MAG: hypothetical protein HUU55_15415 [Myxococcales bacterium]|nr:hypothetical protein [Myxococcales bacterium]